MTGRRFWVTLHRWLGILGGGLIALVGLTGSLNVFHREIDAWVNPTLFTPVVVGGTHGIGADEALAVALAADRSGRVSLIRLPDPVWPVIVVNQTRQTPDGQRLFSIHIDPTTGQVLGSRDYDASFSRTVYKLHSKLLMRSWWGDWVVGIAGILVVISAGSGLWLWWPRTGRESVGAALFRLRRRPLQVFYIDLHNLAGVWIAGLLLVIGLTGIWMALPELVRPAVGLFSETKAMAPVSPARFTWPPAVGASQAQAIAEATVPGAKVGYVSPPHGRRNSWQIGMQGIGGDPRIRSRGYVWVDPATGAVLGILGEGQGSLAQRMEKDLIWLHGGALLGLPGRSLAFVAGLALPFLWVTGLLAWLRRRGRQRALDEVRIAATSS